jgi:hypothetical protein
MPRTARPFIEWLDQSGGPDACWPFTGGCSSNGYGNSWANGKSALAHRVAWERERGPIPSGLDVLHRCDNPPCCNVRHLFLGTDSDNIRDSVAKERHHNARKTHCLRGHPFEGNNLYVNPGGRRLCRYCRQIREGRRRVA